MGKKLDEYLDSLEFHPSRMEELVKEAIKKREGTVPPPLSEQETCARLKLFREKRRMKRLLKYRAALAAACVLLTVGMAAAILRPVGVSGGSAYITFYTEDGGEERFPLRFQEVDTPYGRTHDYGSYEELEKTLGIPLARVPGQEVENVWLEARPGSELYCVNVTFKESAALSGCQAYLAGNGDTDYGHSISQNWERLEEKELGGRRIALYEIRDSGGAFGAAFSENGVLYVTASKGGVSLSAFEELLASISHRP